MPPKEKAQQRHKGRAFKYGRKQQEKIKKEYAASPKVATESVLITVAVDAYEVRDVATFEIPGAYIYTEKYQDVIMLT